MILVHIVGLQVMCWFWGKIDNPYLITFISRTPIFEWYVVWCGSKNKHQIGRHVFQEIGLSAQNMIVIMTT